MNGRMRTLDCLDVFTKENEWSSIEINEEEIKENNSYGLTKVKNVICERQDLDNLLFIARNLKEGYILTDFKNSPMFNEAVKKVLEAYNIKA